MRKSMSTLVIQPSFRALGRTQAKWQTFEKYTHTHTHTHTFCLPSFIVQWPASMCHMASDQPSFVTSNFYLVSIAKRVNCWLTYSLIVKQAILFLRPSAFCFSRASLPRKGTSLFNLHVKPSPASNGVSSCRKS